MGFPYPVMKVSHFITDIRENYHWYFNKRKDFCGYCNILNKFFSPPSRPKCVDEVAFQEEVVAVLKKSLEGADVSSIRCLES